MKHSYRSAQPPINPSLAHAITPKPKTRNHAYMHCTTQPQAYELLTPELGNVSTHDDASSDLLEALQCRKPCFCRAPGTKPHSHNHNHNHNHSLNHNHSNR
jgi:hypothetical protein